MTEIIYMLNNGESVSTKKLAEQFQASDRTIQRYITERLRFLSLIKVNDSWRMVLYL
ncbi:HTH domain-containing protein [Colwellia sp. PAMC 20917]|uniref:HTH domain-containing protein n=1 Tax=Colwellia sp. PAMC 20917 TaxID=1816218 RepID=UPI003FA41DE7